MNYVDIYQEDEEYPHEELLELLGVERKSYGRNIQVRRKSKIPVGRGNERMHEKSSGREDHCERDHRRMRSDASDLLPEFSG